MKSLDTNILVRYYAQDDALQSPLALRIFKDEPQLFVTKTVLLEFFWVLTNADLFAFLPKKSWPFSNICKTCRILLLKMSFRYEQQSHGAMPTLNFQMLCILAASGACNAFLTFDDRKFARRAQRLNLAPICEVPA